MSEKFRVGDRVVYMGKDTVFQKRGYTGMISSIGTGSIGVT